MINKKGQSMGLAIMGLIFFVIIGFTCVNFFFNEVTNARTDLNCTNADDITDGTKLTCLILDITIPYWIWIIVSVGVGFVLVKLAL